MFVTWTWLSVDAVPHSLITCHDVILQDHTWCLVDLKEKTIYDKNVIERVFCSFFHCDGPQWRRSS